MDSIYKLIEWIIIWLNHTILRGYRRWKWDKFTKPVGYVLNQKDYMKLREFWDNVDE